VLLAVAIGVLAPVLLGEMSGDFNVDSWLAPVTGRLVWQSGIADRETLTVMSQGSRGSTRQPMAAGRHGACSGACRSSSCGPTCTARSPLGAGLVALRGLPVAWERLHDLLRRPRAWLRPLALMIGSALAILVTPTG